ncbi:cyclin b1 interacting protein 1 [Plasmopara halstedii]|uniref:Cyclin b1 interacting protein 1 n=1 Tax=Plasmopara halstedii TaxID=4781 RepID=A0A0P1AIK5_PLAHL|nr:cyclin b1 interacting protein 1 [Plasmopara halstedii]CEG40684.1 cyclin b1 interacting protein 1 [Plasmopara halstedii]|eukprot:XP_024577053.1 cyclin b1 interacting protein 1 [Plasmopara halstedii]
MDDDSRMSETSSVRNRVQRHVPSNLGDMDTGDEATLSASHIRPQLRCNACWDPILPDSQSAETCYRTSCGHLFCEKCAYKHFGQGRLKCPACSVDLSQVRDGISETTIHGLANSKRTEAIWEEMMADPSSCFEHFQHALDFVLFQLAQDSFRQEEIRRQQADEQKAFKIQHGEKYIQLKTYTDQLEAELRETKSKMQALTASNDELREAYKEKSRKCRNWEKMCKTLKAHPSARQFPSPTRSTMEGMGMQQQNGASLVTQTSQFNRPSLRPTARSYAVNAPAPSMRNSMANMERLESPRVSQRSNIGLFDRFSRPHIGGATRLCVQPLGGSRNRILRPKTPLQDSQRVGFLSKRPTFRIAHKLGLIIFSEIKTGILPNAQVPVAATIHDTTQIGAGAGSGPASL